MLAAVGLFTAVFNWNAWYDNMLYVKTEGLNTLSFLFVKMIKAQETMENLAATSGVTELANLSGVSSTSLQLATMMIAVLPIMLVYPLSLIHICLPSSEARMPTLPDSFPIRRKPAAGNDLWRQKANPRQNGKGQSGKRAAFSAMPRL